MICCKLHFALIIQLKSHSYSSLARGCRRSGTISFCGHGVSNPTHTPQANRRAAAENRKDIGDTAVSVSVQARFGRTAQATHLGDMALATLHAVARCDCSGAFLRVQ